MMKGRKAAEDILILTARTGDVANWRGILILMRQHSSSLQLDVGETLQSWTRPCSHGQSQCGNISQYGQIICE